MKKYLIILLLSFTTTIAFSQSGHKYVLKVIGGTSGAGSGISQLGISPYGLTKLNDSTYLVDSTLLLTKLMAANLYYPNDNPSNYIQNISGLISQGSNITITGSGTSGDPFIVNSSGSDSTVIKVQSPLHYDAEDSTLKIYISNDTSSSSLDSNKTITEYAAKKFAMNYADSVGGGGGSTDTTSLSNRINENATAITTKQDALVSGTNIKTINGNSLLGSGDLIISSIDSIKITSNSYQDSVWAKKNGVFVLQYVRARLNTPTSLTDGATITWDCKTSLNSYVTLAGNRTLSITNVVAGMVGIIVVSQDATGSRTLALPAGSKVANGGTGVITLTSTANAKDVLAFYYDGTNYFWTFRNNFN